MTELLDATASQMAMLTDLVASLEAAETTLNRMQAARDGMLALAGRLAIDIVRAASHPDHGDMAIRTVAAEIGATQRLSDRTIERRMADASWLVERFPAVWRAQGEGRISAAHARVIVDAGAHLDDAADRSAYAAEAVAIAETESPNRVRPAARRLAERFQERSIAERHRDARDLRRVWVKDLDDGMAELGARGPAVLVHGMLDRLSQMAHVVKEENAREAQDADACGLPPDDRTVDQLRADLLADLVLTGSPAGHDSADGLLSAIHARVEVSVPVLTLMDREAEQTVADPSLPPAVLDGTTPIDLATTRTLVGAASGWDRVFTHPISGAVLAVDRYRPSEHLKRHLRARDQRCRFPGCGITARKCDLDHNQAASTGGATADGNLAAMCRRHHMLKHHSPWHVDQHPGGVLAWRSPTGRSYIDRPPSQNTVTFTTASPVTTPF